MRIAACVQIAVDSMRTIRKARQGAEHACKNSPARQCRRLKLRTYLAFSILVTLKPCEVQVEQQVGDAARIESLAGSRLRHWPRQWAFVATTSFPIEEPDFQHPP